MKMHTDQKRQGHVPGSGAGVTRRGFLGGALLAAGGCLVKAPGRQGPGSGRWYKGMLHCHSYWSDGRAFPEQAVDAYRRLGYDFMSLTDHNRLSMREESWRGIYETGGPWPQKATRKHAENLLGRFPWTKSRTGKDGRLEVRLTPYAELLERFNEPGRFLLMPGMEVTRLVGGGPREQWVHVNYVNLTAPIPSAKRAFLIQDGFRDHTVAGLIASTCEEIELLAGAEGCPPHLTMLNHPLAPYYDIMPQDVIDNPDLRFFEVCNNGSVRAAIPDAAAAAGYEVDRFWDVVNAFRARAGQPLLYATASDDAHWYAFSGSTTPDDCEECYSGDGYVRVRAESLDAASLFAAMDRGDFYASCGLDLEDVAFDGRTLRVRVPPQDGHACRVEFVVTRRDFDDRVLETVRTEETKEIPYVRAVPVYSPSIGTVARTVRGRKGEGLEAQYTLGPDDLYVRARVICDRQAPYWSWRRETPAHMFMHPPCATAWTQPYCHE